MPPNELQSDVQVAPKPPEPEPFEFPYEPRPGFELQYHDASTLSQEVRKQLDLWLDGPPDVQIRGLKLTLEALQTLGDVVIVGGALRSWACGQAPKDLDLIVDTTPDSIARVLGTRTRTAFGGCRLTVGSNKGPNIDIDAWPLKHHHYFVRTGFTPALMNLPRSTFLNVDGIFYYTQPGVLLHTPSWFVDMQYQVICHQHDEPSSHIRMLAKTLRFVESGFSIARSYLSVLGLWLDHEPDLAQQTREYYQRRYGTPKYPDFDLWLERLLR